MPVSLGMIKLSPINACVCQLVKVTSIYVEEFHLPDPLTLCNFESPNHGMLLIVIAAGQAKAIPHINTKLMVQLVEHVYLHRHRSQQLIQWPGHSVEVFPSNVPVIAGADSGNSGFLHIFCPLKDIG